MSANGQADIAIVGMAGLFPQAPTLDVFWQNILGSVDAICEASDTWLGNDVAFDADMKASYRMYTRCGGFLGDLSRFDPRPFGIMPLTVDGSEPDQFLALRCATEALADAGYGPGDYEPERTGVIIGHAVHFTRSRINGVQHTLILDQTIGLLRSLFPEITEDRLQTFRGQLKKKLPNLAAETAPGLVPNILTGRISNRLNLMGPNYILDAACASSLIAVDAAMSELRAGRCDVMLAGGVNTTTPNMVYMLFCELGALSRRAKVRPFSAGSDGVLLGEGQGLFVLKRLDDAIRNGDRIYAVVKGVGASSDGRAMGMLAPRLEGEILAIERAYQHSGIDPATIGLLEAHGTGIPLGDQTEVAALRHVFGRREKRYPDIALGSVKSNIGHCIPAAGAAAIVKVAMALYHKVLPPTLCEEVSPDLGLDDTRFHVNTEALPWIHSGRLPRRAAIDAFGFGGVNSHMILEEAPDNGDHPGAAFGFRLPNEPQLVVLAAPDRPGLIQAVEALQRDLAADPDRDLRQRAAQLAAELGHGRERLAVVATSTGELARQLGQIAKRLADPSVHRVHTRGGAYFRDAPIDGKVAFMFPGEGSQYVGMLRELAVWSPLVRQWFDFLDHMFADRREVPHRVLLFPPSNGISADDRDEMEQRLYRVDDGSEAMFCADQAIFGLLSALGVQPDFIVGHSTGENAALVASKLFDLNGERLADCIRRMNDIFSDLEAGGAIPNAVLLTVGAVPRETLLATVTRYPEVAFTMDNCPNQAVLCGPDAAIETLATELSHAGGVCSRLPMSWAYHTPAVAPMAEAFRALFQDIASAQAPKVPVYSCTTADRFPDRPEAVLDLAIAQYTGAVRFTETIEKLYGDGARIFVEIGPSAHLSGFVRDILRHRDHLSVAADIRQRCAVDQLHHLMAQLFVAGVPIDFAARYRPADLESRPQPAPYLPNDVPFLRLSDSEAAETRLLLFGQSATAAGDAAPGPIPEPVAAGGSVVAAEARQMARPAAARTRPQPRSVGADRRAGVVNQHLSLMGSFLDSQATVTLTGIGRPPGNGQARATVKRWTSYFHPPTSTEVFLARPPAATSGDPGLRRLAATVLSPPEQNEWAEVTARNPNRGREWLLARLAAKNAVRAWLHAHAGLTADPAEIAIRKTELGRPMVVLRNGLASHQLTPSVSMTHIDGFALAAACRGGVGIGVDVEGVQRVRDGAGLLRHVGQASEIEMVERLFPNRWNEGAVLLWAVKEAAAKALGTGLLGRPQDFLATEVSPDGRWAQVRCGDQRVGVQVVRLATYMCALGHDVGATPDPGATG